MEDGVARVCVYKCVLGFLGATSDDQRMLDHDEEQLRTIDNSSCDSSLLMGPLDGKALRLGERVQSFHPQTACDTCNFKGETSDRQK